MSQQTDAAVEQALDNLEQIKAGADPRSQSRFGSQDTAMGSDPDSDSNGQLDAVKSLVDELFESDAYDEIIPDSLKRSDISVYVADWQRKIGNCKYGTRIEPDEYGQRVPHSARTRSNGSYAIGVAQRAFDESETWRDTVRHECAHVTAYVEHGGSQGHNHIWKHHAEALGADPTRTDRVDPENRVDTPYFIGCPDCETQFGKLRRSQRIQHPGRYVCGRCGTNCVSWARGDPQPDDPGTCAVDCSDL